MGKEIEKKFLLKNSDWKKHIDSILEIKQGYLNSNPERVVRVRVQNQTGIITIKSKNVGISRQEFEYNIPYADSLELLKLCEPIIISKTRYNVIVNNNKWEIDIFKEENFGLEVAEIELASEEEEFILPDWIDKEVTFDKRYRNSNLIGHPYINWSN